jgi:hypothetical protein
VQLARARAVEARVDALLVREALLAPAPERERDDG